MLISVCQKSNYTTVEILRSAKKIPQMRHSYNDYSIKSINLSVHIADMV